MVFGDTVKVAPMEKLWNNTKIRLLLAADTDTAEQFLEQFGAILELFRSIFDTFATILTTLLLMRMHTVLLPIMLSLLQVWGFKST